MNRRTFSKRTLAALASITVVPRHVLGGTQHKAPGDKLNIAGIARNQSRFLLPLGGLKKVFKDISSSRSESDHKASKQIFTPLLCGIGAPLHLCVKKRFTPSLYTIALYS
ncbi:hypothetical protein GF407_00600 [candidate division KSB1 bacterium]|nr:hypothetical protein [candidate division KSB1 bacterium]